MRSEDSHLNAGESPRSISSRWPELLVAAFLFALGVLVIIDSIRVGYGWADDGPRSGYFPFFIGLGLAGSSAAIAIGQLRRWNAKTSTFINTTQASQVWAVFWPLVLYVAALKVLGLYVSSAVLIGYFMRRHGRYAWKLVWPLSLGVPLLVYFLFERWFLVLLPKGLLASWIGL